MNGKKARAIRRGVKFYAQLPNSPLAGDQSDRVNGKLIPVVHYRRIKRLLSGNLKQERNPIKPEYLLDEWEVDKANITGQSERQPYGPWFFEKAAVYAGGLIRRIEAVRAKQSGVEPKKKATVIGDGFRPSDISTKSIVTQRSQWEKRQASHAS